MAASGHWLPDYLTQQSSQHSLHMLREHVCSLVSARTLATLLIHPPVPTSKHPSPPEPICPFQGLTQVTWLSYLLVIVPKWTSLLKPPPVCSGLADCALNPLPWTLCEDLPSPSYHPSLSCLHCSTMPFCCLIRIQSTPAPRVPAHAHSQKNKLET